MGGWFACRYTIWLMGRRGTLVVRAPRHKQILTIMAFIFTRIVRYVIFAVILYSMLQYALRWKSYSISPKVFRQACTVTQGTSGISIVNKLRNDLRRSYPSQIVDSDWEAVYGGGLNLQMNILYASITEFIIVFRAPYRTAGFAGNFFPFPFSKRCHRTHMKK
ncbi:unnamed protein product [Onchocerca flexuosa]|uniref:Sigma non-opioid intracellular receptor 1 n=1 Tax=Onchocerca flexuosa TaxID=387005 RepID=A0A183I2C1_9BILA|nr:unnamed protein product [Onchocerca flexuosa]